MKDIILLAMSTLPRKLRSDDFTVAGADDIIDCRSQLESVARYFISQSSADDILVLGLCTMPTLEDEVIYQAEGTKDKAAYICSTPDQAENGRPVTAWGYFRERVAGSPEARGKRIIFNAIPTDENHPASAVKDVIRFIRNADARGQLFVSNNGGLRNLYLFLSAILSLLEHEGIRPFRIMGTVYNPEKRIVDQSKAFEMFSFVAGMTDLLETGDADVLDRFFGGSKQPGHVKAVVAAMKDVAYGTQLCDPDLYERGLDALEPAMKALEADTGTDSLLDIFMDQIREDYGVLLKKDQRTTPDIIRWCLRKKLYQQALTFLESRMPAYFYRTHFYYYDPAFNTDISRRKAKYEAAESYVFDRLLQKCGFGTNMDPADGREEFLAIRYYAGEQVTLKNGRTFEVPVDFRQETTLPAAFKDPKRNKTVETGYKLVPGEGLYWSTALPENSWPEAGRLMRMHRALKACRNLFNHGLSGQRPRLEDIKKVMELYLEEVKSLTALCTEERCLQAEQEAGLSAEKAVCAASPDAEKYFVNFSNHPSSEWEADQISKARAYGQIVDLPFPPVPGDAGDQRIKKMAEESIAEIMAYQPAAVMCQGEFTLSYAVTRRLLEEGVIVLAACSERDSVIQDGKRITEFKFTKFRKYK